MKSKLALLNVEVEEAWKAKEHVRVASEFLVSLKVCASAPSKRRRACIIPLLTLFADQCALPTERRPATCSPTWRTGR